MDTEEAEFDVPDQDAERASYDYILTWMHQRLLVLGFEDALWASLDERNTAVIEFVTGLGPKTLSIVKSGDGRLHVLCEEIGKNVLDKDLCGYFLRSNPVSLSRQNIVKEVQFGMIGGKGLSLMAFERIMKGLVEKHVQANNDLTGHYHRCMATLTDAVHFSDGRTVLYCPHFEYTSVAEAANDKGRLQIMESIVIHWTRQIKDVVNNHDSSGSAEASGPLDEIEFWKVRAQDLIGIQQQLESDDVRRIIDVLQYGKSNYIAPFRSLTQQIVSRAAESNDNLKFLESIRAQCTALRTIPPEKILSILPDLLNRIRLIWSFSSFYNDDEHISGLLRKISNEIIRRFRGHIDLREVLDGDVEFSISRLRDAILCGVQWKEMYHDTVQAIARQKERYRGRCWQMDDASIFAQIDAFVQRCRDLIEICEAQMQFVRKSAATKGSPGPLPHFGGTKAQEIVEGVLGIQESFEHHIDRLRRLQYDVLDVKASRWHDDYNHFKSDVKDLEVMFTNVINAAFEQNSTVSDGVALVETFFRLAKRETILRCVERKATETNQMFLKQVAAIRSEFEVARLSPPLRLHEPQLAGSALWAHSLVVLVQESFDRLVRLRYVLSEREFDESHQAMSSLSSVIQDFKKARYSLWLEDLGAKAKDNGLQTRLEKPLLRRADPEAAATNKVGAEIVCNFDEDVLVLFSEVSYWEKFQGEFAIPYVAHDLCNKREQLRVMRENVMLVVRAYNDIIRDLSVEEKRLFLDHLRKLDRRIAQGMTKLTWQNRAMIEMYVRDCCASCHEVHSIVREFKDCKATIARITKSIASAFLLRVDKNQIYESGVFEKRQNEHRAAMFALFEQHYTRILSLLRSVYKNFKEGSNEVLREWRSQIAQIDKHMESALKQAVKRSLQELSRAINGDSKTEPQTLFTVNILLEEMRVSYSPSMVNLTHSVNVVAKEVIAVVTAVPRVRAQNFDSTNSNSNTSSAGAAPSVDFAEVQSNKPTAQTPSHAQNENMAAVNAEDLSKTTSTANNPSNAAANNAVIKSYYEIISEDADILRIVVQVMNGMSSTATELQKYLSYWDKYKALWEAEKDSAIKRYAKANNPPAQFDLDITRYKVQQAEINGETSTHVINFVRIDCNAMKEALIGHCLQSQAKLTGLLNNNGNVELSEIFSFFSTCKERLSTAPSSLDELSQQINFCKDTKEQLSSIQARFDPVREIYATLSKFEVAVRDEEVTMLTSLDTQYDEFLSFVHDTEKLLDKSKVSMKRDLETQMDSYSAQMNDLRTNSHVDLPFSDEIPAADALAMIETYKQKIARAKEREASLATGLSIFGIPSTEHRDLTALTRDVDLLSQIWTLTVDWQTQWDDWKNGQFNDLAVEEMENVVGIYLKKVGKLGREIKRWRVWEHMKNELDAFRETIPLIQDLRNRALRPRHWAALQERVSAEFDPRSPSFTLNEVVKLGLHTHAEFINELSANANKELAIETALADLEQRWSSVALDVGVYKDKYFKLKAVDDISQFLEDDSVALSTMKSSKFYSSFQRKIDEWEATLSTISEVVESLLGVQRKWIYLESIFMSGGDIAKQLPHEYTLFVSVNNDFLRVMESFYRDPNAKRTCLAPGLLASIAKMDEGLERIQKSLDQYLETKRMVFPRFYFVSDDDLLEILGQSKDPIAVQKHVKKCFEGIKTLKMVPLGSNANNATTGANNAANAAGNTVSGAVNVVLSGKALEATHMFAPDGETAPFVESVLIDGPVELWLVQVEKAMRRGISKLLSASITAFKGKKEKWVKETIGQLLITTGAIVWTLDCTKALVAIAAGTKGALKQQKKRQVSYLNKLTALIRSSLSKIDRNKVVALITMEIHNRDVIERMIKANCNSVSDFEWLSQLRFVYNKEQGEFGKCEVRQTNSVLEYSYEYQGNNGRLVVTPLTDRCVLTLITAMYLNRGGNPLGPAGTGKTETVKDLGKNLAKYVVVINCSDGMDYKSVGRIFSGLVQSGSWGCFDEFNRIKIEVISVVAMQILSILNALSAKVSAFSFMGTTIPCNPNCGIFITMNPGYAGRTELPDNLKALMRPVAMMAPDLTMIAEVMLASEGFNEARVMAKKTVTLYSLMIQQLSKQDHYDYGLRNLKAVLNMAGQLKRSDATMSEEAILMRALRDMNLPKFIKDDERLFRLLLGDLFPGLELPVSEYGTLQNALENELQKAGLQKHDFLLAKMFQFYDSRLTRHCNMLVGDPLGGKSTAWKMLAAAQTTLAKSGVEGFMAVTPFVINPKSIELDELYGAYDLATFEWRDGILSTIFKQCSEDEKPIEKWILFDGPIDAMWIESMNSVMDDNKILTLINGDRIPLTNTMSLVFETQDLRVASPATVSRAGMIYIDATELGWRTYTESWLQSRARRANGNSPGNNNSNNVSNAGNANTGGGNSNAILNSGSTASLADEETTTLLRDLLEKYLPKVLKFKELQCVEPVKTSDFACVMNLCALFDALCAAESASLRKDTLGGDYHAVVEKVFLFSLTWTVGASVDEMSRKRFSTCLADIEAIFPPTNTVFDYYVDVSKNELLPWENKVPNWRAQKTMSFHDMVVPTTDSVRNGFVAETLLRVKKHVLLVGATGTGKTILAQQLLRDLPVEKFSQLVINFSAATTSAVVQEIIEAPMEKRSKDKLGPLGGKHLVLFIDDLNMPKMTSSESPFQPPLELVRLWMDYNGWYDRHKCNWKFLLDTQLLAAMGHPGGGRNVICARTQSRFALLNLTFPSDSQIVKIFDSILQSKFVEYDQEIKQLSVSIATSTLNVFKAVNADFLATPEKFHYIFNIRDVAKVTQGMLLASRATIFSPEGMLRLWAHECQRVFSDRFLQTKSNDELKFRDILAAKMHESMGKDWASIMSDALDPKQGPLFCALLQELGENGEPTYEEVTDYKKVRLMIEEKLEDYNMEPKLIPMDLSMFRDAIMHVCRIHRAIIQPRGNMLLVGVGGSGRSSLTRLAAYIAGMLTFSIEITKNYRLLEFREDIKKLYTMAGAENKRVVFLFNDTQIKDEAFLEDINNILSSGIVPNLFGKDEMPALIDAVRKPAVSSGVEETADALWRFFIDRVRANLHVVLAMSPIGEALRRRCRMYPGLVNCTTIDWFHTWPAEALQEVAMKFLAQVEFKEEDYRHRISAVFAEMHIAVINQSRRMELELKRFNYVTPTNYLELVKGYRSLLTEKTSELGSAANKLANGLAKLEDARTQVESLSKELEVKKVVVAQSQKDCEDLLVQIVSERRVADEQRKQVEADSARIAQEALECKAISDDAEADLAIAMPALEKAMEEVEKLDKSAVSEVKAYTKPPALVETVLQAVMILFNKPTDWATAKKILSESNFLQQIKGFDKDHVSLATNNKIKKYVEMPTFKPEEVKKVSGAAAALCVWVHAIYIYANVAKEVAPKRQRLKEATESLASKQAALKDAQDALAAVVAKLAALQVSYDTSVNEKNRLRDEAETLQNKLDRADKLVNGLAGEYTRWQSSIGEYNAALVRVTGDALLAAAFLSYAGPFETSYRHALQKSWQSSVLSPAHKLPCTENFQFATFLARSTDVRDWNIQGLPKDDFSTENGVISTRARRWPLMIDPQGQANRWIRNKEGSKLRIIDLKMTGFLREVENAVQYGFPVLLQDILEEIDPALEPVLSKSVLKVSGRDVLRLGDKELDYSPDFKLYITTKLANPHYTPEISTKANVVNFAVKKDGLEAQLLGIVVQREEPNLEQQKSELTVRVAAGKRQLVELEDEILRLLSESKGSLLDDIELVNTLQQSKITSEAVTQQLIEAEATEKKIDAARLGYRSAAVRASLAYFVLDDMSRVDPMYQFSLDAYVALFISSIERSRTKAGSLDVPVNQRCEDINTEHTLAVYKYTCRGLFEAHKLLFSLQLCIKILESNGAINAEEFHFFTVGVGLIDRALQRRNPAEDWLPSGCWDSLTELDKLAGFQGIVSSFEQMQREWRAWYASTKPESEAMPGEWTVKCSELQKLCLLKALREDRLLFGCSRFIAANIGPEFVDPPPFDLKAVYESSSCKTPLVFVLSPGVDPTAGILSLAHNLGVKVENCALGQGQAPTAVRMIEEGAAKGNWVFLANCHLMLSWMPVLEKMIESLIVEGNPHTQFRLWLSSAPDPHFPISILQRGIKMTTEPPKGLRSNMLNLYNTISDEPFTRCAHVAEYKRLLFALTWFHAILLERRKFKSLGFNIPYDFNESDFAICHDLVIVFLDEYPDRVPFDAMKYLIAEANYGGRVTDDWDRRLVNVYIGELFCEDCLTAEKFMLSDLPDYFIGEEGDLKFYKEQIRAMPGTDHPLAFGQHANSDMAASIDDARTLIDTLVSLQPRIVKASASDEEAVDPLAAQCADLLQQTNEPFDMRSVREKLETRSDPDPLKTVLYQELDRYNRLLNTLRRTLTEIMKVTQGTASTTAELEEVILALSQLKVPRLWGSTYPSLKPLGSWMRDLSQRVEFFTSWVDDCLPTCWWLPAMTYPTGFLTAVLQVSARLNGVSIDSLSYETPVSISGDKTSVSGYPKDGVFVSGIFLEGATWNFTGGFLEESRPMELISNMPIIHFKPVEGKRRVAKGFYTCPLYMYPIRSGTRERPSYVVSVELRAGKFSSDFWTKRGVAMLLSTAL